jgi:hypothetical protein
MTSRAVEGACAFAWRTYLLTHQGVNENDNRRAALHRYVNDLRDSGERDFDVLQIAGIVYLKKLDELGEDRRARDAAAAALVARISRHHASA